MTSNGEEDQSVKKSGELKFPKDDEEAEEEEDFLEDQDQDQDQNNPSTNNNNNINNNNKRICHFCGKGFASGKALGGHMRIHFQLHKQPFSSNSKKKLKPTKKTLPKHPSSSEEEYKDQNITLSDFAKKSENINEDNPIRCYLCFKSFPSMKSLFGHMRCHPDRDQRGYNPPPRLEQEIKTTHTSSSSLVSDLGPQLEDQVDLMKSLRGCNWVVTAKRGSKGISKKPILDDNNDDDKEFLDAANELMRLAHGSGAIDEHEATNSNSLEPISGSKKKRKLEEIEGLIEMGNNKAAAAAVSDDNEAGRSVQCPSKSSNGKVKKKKKRKKIKDLELLGEDIVSPVPVVDKAMGTAAAATPDDKYYRCSSCDKSFPTYQALGGHRSTHNKIKVLGNENVGLEDQEIMTKENKIAAANNGNISTPRDRRKWSDQALSSHITSVGVQLSHTCGGGSGRVLEFDLNEVPPMEDEGTGGLASSSINSVDQFSVFESSSRF